VGARVLNAGCFTGVDAAELVRRGFDVVAVDASMAFLELVRSRAPAATRVVAELTKVSIAPPCDAVFCRGVLNDIVVDDERQAICDAFARSLRPGGVAILEARELVPTLDRYREPSRFERTVNVGAADVRYLAEMATRGELVAVRETVSVASREASVFEYAMRCWTKEEFRARLEAAGFHDVTFPEVDAFRGRLVALATR